MARRTQQRRRSAELEARAIVLECKRAKGTKPPRHAGDLVETLRLEIADLQAIVLAGLAEALDDGVLTKGDYGLWLDWVGDGTRGHRGFAPLTQNKEFKDMISRNWEFLEEYEIFKEVDDLRKKTVVLFDLQGYVRTFSR